jgi:hypothetical protein
MKYIEEIGMDYDGLNAVRIIASKLQKVLVSKLDYFLFNLLSIALIMLSLLVSYPLPVRADELPINYTLTQAMTSMNIAMSSVPMTGNPDIDFAIIMIPHHQGAIEMAKTELQYGTDPRLRRLAQEIIVTQQSEIELMQLAVKHPLSAQFP